jgi:hypothetical protein
MKGSSGAVREEEGKEDGQDDLVSESSHSLMSSLIGLSWHAYRVNPSYGQIVAAKLLRPNSRAPCSLL